MRTLILLTCLLFSFEALAQGLSGTGSGISMSTTVSSSYNTSNSAAAYQISGANGISYPTGDNTAGGSIAIGASALANETAAGAAAYDNTVIGYQAMGTGTLTTAAVNNVALGFQAGKVMTAGTANTLLGWSSGLTLTAGTNNTIIGAGVASTTITTGSNNILIGVSNAVTTAANNTSNTIQIGGTAASGGVGSINVTGTGTLATEVVTLRGTLILSDIASDATHTDGTVCQDTTTHTLFTGSGVAGICLGTSSIRFKHGVKKIKTGLAEVNELKPVTFYYKKGYGDNGARHQYGFIAEDVYKVIPELTAPDKDGKPQSVDYMGFIPVLVKAVQEQQKQIDDLKAIIDKHR